MSDAQALIDAVKPAVILAYRRGRRCLAVMATERRDYPPVAIDPHEYRTVLTDAADEFGKSLRKRMRDGTL